MASALESAEIVIPNPALIVSVSPTCLAAIVVIVAGAPFATTETFLKASDVATCMGNPLYFDIYGNLLQDKYHKETLLWPKYSIS